MVTHFLLIVYQQMTTLHFNVSPHIIMFRCLYWFYQLCFYSTGVITFFIISKNTHCFKTLQSLKAKYENTLHCETFWEQFYLRLLCKIMNVTT